MRITPLFFRDEIYQFAKLYEILLLHLRIQIPK
jgi:hypothetical protein